MFLDENAGLIFFRRLSWSPEGVPVPHVCCPDEGLVPCIQPHGNLVRGYEPGVPAMCCTVNSAVGWAGSMLTLPTGLHKATAEDLGTDCTYIYARGHWNAPVLALPSLKVRHTL